MPSYNTHLPMSCLEGGILLPPPLNFLEDKRLIEIEPDYSETGKWAMRRPKWVLGFLTISFFLWGGFLWAAEKGDDPDLIRRGLEVFEEKCMGCHHPQYEAFGPPFSEIAKNKTIQEIMAYIQDPRGSAASLGYVSSMTRIELSPEDLRAAAAFIWSFRDK